MSVLDKIYNLDYNPKGFFERNSNYKKEVIRLSKIFKEDLEKEKNLEYHSKKDILFEKAWRAYDNEEQIIDVYNEYIELMELIVE